MKLCNLFFFFLAVANELYANLLRKNGFSSAGDWDFYLAEKRISVKSEFWRLFCW